jgi:hypothetical protein
MARSSSTGGAPGGGYSGSSYDRWSYEQASRTGTGGSNDNPLNKLQYKYWVTKSKVVRKLGKDEDECVVASDAELDAKLELYNSISETTKDLQRILDQYNDRLCSKLSLRISHKMYIIGQKKLVQFCSSVVAYDSLLERWCDGNLRPTFSTNHKQLSFHNCAALYK